MQMLMAIITETKGVPFLYLKTATETDSKNNQDNE